MKRNRYIKIFAITFVILTAFVSVAATPVNTYSYKVVLPDTPLYLNADMESEVIMQLPQNSVVEIIDKEVIVDGKIWSKVKYTIYEGYVVSDALYKSIANDNYNAKPITFISKEMGKDIELYETHGEGAPVVCTVHDGEKARLINTGIDYGEFAYVEYDGNYYFAHDYNITEGLGYNQLLAVIISCSFVGVLIIAAIVTVIVRKKKRVN